MKATLLLLAVLIFSSYSFAIGRTVQLNLAFSIGAKDDNITVAGDYVAAQDAGLVLAMISSGTTTGTGNTTNTVNTTVNTTRSDWWNPSWTYRKNLTFNSSGQGEALFNFTVLVKLNSTNFEYNKSTQYQLRFIDEDGSTVLAHHTELWNASGDSYIWVRVPNITNTSADFISMYYNSTAATDIENATGTYDADYEGVWHLSQNSAGGLNASDSTVNANHGTALYGATVNTSGQIDGAAQFDGINDSVRAGTTGFSNATSTVEAWVNMNNNNPSNNYSIFNTPSEISSGDDSLVLLMHFSQNSTASEGVKDSSPYGNNGTATGALFTNEGRFQTAWRFDGADDYINISTESNFDFERTSPFTFSAWIKSDVAAVGQHILSKGDSSDGLPGYRFLVRSDDKLGFEIGNTASFANRINTGTDATFDFTKWRHVAVTYTGSSNAAGVKLYVDGVSYSHTAGDNSLVSSTLNNEPFIIGNLGPTASNPFDGTIDEVAIYNRTLSAAEIRDRYLGGLSLHKMGDELRFVAGNTTLTYNVSSWTGWHHVAGTYNATVATLYTDGVQRNTSSNRGSLILGNDTFVGGANGTITFNGSIDEVRISSVPRSAAWINASYKGMNSSQNFIAYSAEDQNSTTETSTETSEPMLQLTQALDGNRFLITFTNASSQTISDKLKLLGSRKILARTFGNLAAAAPSSMFLFLRLEYEDADITTRARWGASPIQLLIKNTGTDVRPQVSIEVVK